MIVVVFLILSVSLLANPPHWYIYQGIPTKDFEIIGYGEGKTLAEAKQVAKSDIAKSIYTNLSSSISINKTFQNGNYTKNINQNIDEKTQVFLTDIETIESDYKEGKFFVAMRYINLPFSKKVKVMLSDISQVKKSSSAYLNKTQFLKELKNEFGFFPKIEIVKNNISINNQLFYLNNNEFLKLFANIDNESLNISMKNHYVDGEYYFIKTIVNKNGYFSIFQVYESGETVLLLANQKVQKNYNSTFPNPKKYNGLESIVPKGKNKTKDLIIAALCNKKMDLSLFDRISVANDVKSLLFGELLSLIENCRFTTKVILTKGK
jgi:ribosomal protein S8